MVTLIGEHKPRIRADNAW